MLFCATYAKYPKTIQHSYVPLMPSSVIFAKDKRERNPGYEAQLKRSADDRDRELLLLSSRDIHPSGNG